MGTLVDTPNKKPTLKFLLDRNIIGVCGWGGLLNLEFVS